MFFRKGYTARAENEPMKSFSFERQDPEQNDVQIAI